MTRSAKPWVMGIIMCKKFGNVVRHSINIELSLIAEHQLDTSVWVHASFRGWRH